MHHLLKRIMRNGEIIEAGAMLELTDDEVANLSREGCVETADAKAARELAASHVAKAEREAAAMVAAAKSEVEAPPPKQRKHKEAPTGV